MEEFGDRGYHRGVILCKFFVLTWSIISRRAALVSHTQIASREMFKSSLEIGVRVNLRHCLIYRGVCTSSEQITHNAIKPMHQAHRGNESTCFWGTTQAGAFTFLTHCWDRFLGSAKSTNRPWQCDAQNPESDFFLGAEDSPVPHAWEMNAVRPS
jgi:hypothetical protein